MLSGTAEYALRAVVFLAQAPRGKPVRANDLAAAVDVPRHYLGTILRELVRARMLRSTRGQHGGFHLVADPATLSLLDVIRLFDHMAVGHRCLLGHPDCDARGPCPAHDRWQVTSEQVTRFFHDTRLADLLGQRHA